MDPVEAEIRRIQAKEKADYRDSQKRAQAKQEKIRRGYRTDFSTAPPRLWRKRDAK